MKMFISWSGDLSRDLGETLKVWFPKVLQSVKPYFTPDDIEKGARWESEIAKELDDSHLGVFCLTRANLDAKWLMFEAGAISKRLGKSSVCPLLFGVGTSDIVGPMEHFQATTFSENEMRKLVLTINGLCGKSSLEESTCKDVFDKWWPDLESEIKQVHSEHEKQSTETIRTEREILEEILELTRLSARFDSNRRGRPFSFNAVKDLVSSFLSLILSIEHKSSIHIFKKHLIEIWRPVEYIGLKTAKSSPGSSASDIHAIMGEINCLLSDEPILNFDFGDDDDQPGTGTG